MVEVPRIVRERLREQGAAGEHPDANLLSGFAEHRLYDGERAQVLEHLARCAKCREVLALTQPQAEELQPGTSVIVARSWWRSPVVHWSVLVTAAVVVLIAVAMHPHRQRQGYSASAPAALDADYSAAHPPAAASPQKPAVTQASAAASRPPTRKPEAPVGEESRADKKKAQAKQDQPAPPAASSPNRDRLTEFASGAGGNAPAPPPPPAPASQQRDFSAGSQDSAAVAQAQSQAAATATVTGGAIEMKRSVSAQETGKAGGVTAPAAKNEIATFGKNAGRSLALRASLSPRWSISESGALQRSLDAGRSWTVVDVAKGVTFRAVATVGNEIWAGGSGGALYHSADDGETWGRVRIQAGGRFLTGDITRVEFATASDGVLTTSTGENWSTLDGGSTWQRR
jgi:hypothetical protein